MNCEHIPTYQSLATKLATCRDCTVLRFPSFPFTHGVGELYENVPLLRRIHSGCRHCLQALWPTTGRETRRSKNPPSRLDFNDRKVGRRDCRPAVHVRGALAGLRCVLVATGCPLLASGSEPPHPDMRLTRAAQPLPIERYRRRTMILFTLSPVFDFGWPATLVTLALIGIICLTTPNPLRSRPQPDCERAIADLTRKLRHPIAYRLSKWWR